jgi:hypothetical protein
MDTMVALTIDNVTVPNEEDPTANRFIPRPVSIDRLCLRVTAHDRVLVVAGWGAGKSTLMKTILRGHSGISVASGYQLVVLDGDACPAVLDTSGVYIKDNFDPAKHRPLLQACKTASCTLLAASEIDKLPNLGPDDFGRIVVIDDGRIVADQADDDFEPKLVRWIDKYARDRSRHLRKDSKFLRDHFRLQLESAWPDCQ